MFGASVWNCNVLLMDHSLHQHEMTSFISPSSSLKSVLSDIKGTDANAPRGLCQAPGSGFCCERLCSFCRRVANTGSHLESILCGV